jgi:hypothetical protein
MIEGERERKQGAHDRSAFVYDDPRLDPTRPQDCDLRGDDDEHGMASAQTTEIRQGDRRTAQVGGAQGARLRIRDQPIDRLANLPRVGVRGVSQDGREESLRGLDRDREIDVIVQPARQVALVEPSVDGRFQEASRRHRADEPQHDVRLRGPPGLDIDLVHHGGGRDGGVGPCHVARHRETYAPKRLFAHFARSGRDRHIDGCLGSMWATIEAVE